MNPYQDEINKELMLNAEIQRQNLKALPKAFKDRKVISPVTQKMIDEFKQQFNKKKGDKAYLFPDYKPDFIDLSDELNKLPRPLDENDIYDINNELNHKIKIYKLLNDTMIPQHTRIIGENKDKINELNDKMIDATKNKDKKNLLYKQNKLIEEIKKLEKFIIRDNNDMIDLQSDINQLQRLLEENNELITNYKNVEYTVNEKNKKKLSDYANNLSILNEGKINVIQQPGESEQEYLERLSNMFDEEYDDTELIERAYLSNITEFKENMKKILSSEWKIESIMNSLEREEVFLLNKIFPSYEKLVKKLYGLNNQNITPELYVDLIRTHFNHLEPIQKADAYYKEKQELTDEFYDNIFYPSDEIIEGSPYAEPKYREESSDNDIIYINTGTSLEIKNIINNKRVFIQLQKTNKTIQAYYKYDSDDEYQLLKPFKTKFNELFVDYLELTPNQIVNEFIYSSSRDKTFNMRTFVAKLRKDRNLIPINLSKVMKDEIADMEVKSSNLDREDTYIDSIIPKYLKGKGLDKDLPKTFLFGRINILLDKLYYKNILSIKDKNLMNIQGIPNSKVSDDFVDLIMRIIEDKETSKDDILDLNEKEQELYSLIMYKSGFYKQKKLSNNIKSINKLIIKLKQRFDLINGEIIAGNNNDDNFKEIYSVIFKLTNLGALNLSEGRKYYKELVKQYK